MKALFVCNQGRNRSRTAAEMLTGFETRYKGLFNEHPLSASDLAWADVVFVMEDHQRTEISRRFPGLYLEKRIVSLAIPDIFSYGQPELKSLLRKKLRLAKPVQEMRVGIEK